MLMNKLERLETAQLEQIYNKCFSAVPAGTFAADDIRVHLIAYVVQYYQFRSLKVSFRLKAKKIIELIKTA
jgi:hypothetical protein